MPRHNGWWLAQLQLQAAGPCTLRLPAGLWRLSGAEAALPQQPAPGGGTWVQLALPAGVAAVPLERCPSEAVPALESAELQHPVALHASAQGWQLSNGLVRAQFGPARTVDRSRTRKPAKADVLFNGAEESGIGLRAYPLRSSRSQYRNLHTGDDTVRSMPTRQAKRCDVPLA